MTESTKNNAQFVDVYVAEIPLSGDFVIPPDPIFPPARQAEIVACASEKAKREKFFAWKLLAHAIEKSYGLDAREVQFTKTEHGKWICDRFGFSISHSENAVCVALAPCPVGVDVERLRQLKTRDFATKILSETELAAYHTTPESEQNEFLIRAWTRKESLFKLWNKSGFFSAEPKTLQGETDQQTVIVANEPYALSVATETPLPVQVFYHAFV